MLPFSRKNINGLAAGWEMSREMSTDGWVHPYRLYPHSDMATVFFFDFRSRFGLCHSRKHPGYAYATILRQ